MREDDDSDKANEIQCAEGEQGLENISLEGMEFGDCCHKGWFTKSTEILKPKKIKSVTVSTFSHLFAMK